MNVVNTTEALNPVRLRGVYWKERFAEKIAEKHGVSMEEVEQVLFGRALVRRAQRGRVQGEDLYAGYGQTRSGRHLVVFFIRKRGGMALPITARPMSNPERRYFRGYAK